MTSYLYDNVTDILKITTTLFVKRTIHECISVEACKFVGILRPSVQCLLFVFILSERSVKIPGIIILSTIYEDFYFEGDYEFCFLFTI